MEQIALVKGMKCTHCEMHVKETLSQIPGVKEVKADHVKGEVSIISDVPIKMEAIKDALSKTKYHFEGLK